VLRWAVAGRLLGIAEGFLSVCWAGAQAAYSALFSALDKKSCGDMSCCRSWMPGSLSRRIHHSLKSRPVLLPQLGAMTPLTPHSASSQSSASTDLEDDEAVEAVEMLLEPYFMQVGSPGFHLSSIDYIFLIKGIMACYGCKGQVNAGGLPEAGLKRWANGGRAGQRGLWFQFPCWWKR
jgi:hypothetical protein